MSTVSGLDPNVAARLVDEGYGPGAWHGPNLKAALTDIAPRAALWRPGPGRHNVAEIALHHAWCVRSVIGRLTGDPPEPFVLEGEDWFDGIHSPLSERERFDLVLGITCHAVYHAGQVQLLKVLGAARA